MYYAYILQSKKDKSFYIGSTENLQKRIAEHNSGATKSIQDKIPYSLVWFAVFREKQKSIEFEKYLKSSSGFAFRNKHLI